MIEVSLGHDFERLMKALNDFAKFRHKVKTSALRKMAQTHKQQIRERLITKKSGPDGESWAPWAKETEARRRSNGTAGSGLLIEKRKLVNSFHVVFTAGKGTLGSSLPYAAALHFGNPSRRLPARPYAGVGRTDVKKLQDTLDTWVKANHPFK